MNGGTNGTNGVNGHRSSAICNSAEEFLAHEYDFVIVGGGTAGLVVAARLTENPGFTVGVIEAGRNRLGDMLVDTPALFLQMLGNEDYDWKFHTTPQARPPFPTCSNMWVDNIFSRKGIRATFITWSEARCLEDLVASTI